MNKPLLLALSTAALALTGLTPQVVLAQPYVELGAGMSRADVDCAGTIRCDDTSAQARVTAGWSFGDSLAAEVTLAQIGKLSASAVVPMVGRVDADVRLRQAGIGVASRLPLTDTLALTARLGVASNQTRVSGTAGGMRTSDSQRNTAAYAGIGLSYALTPTVALGLNVEGTRVRYDGEDANVTMAGLSVRTRF